MPKEPKKILVSVTTTCTADPEKTNDWRSQVDELRKLGLTEVALFPTRLEYEGRRDLYRAIADSPVERVPFVHLRTDMEIAEIRFLMETFGTERFNLHGTEHWPLRFEYPADIAGKIFVENTRELLPEADVRRFGGICVDFAHWENAVLIGVEGYDSWMRSLLERYRVGACHVSAIGSEEHEDPYIPGETMYDTHVMTDLSQLDYLGTFREFVPDVVAIELENPIAEQLRVREYLQGILSAS